jgi:hypothetical protein
VLTDVRASGRLGNNWNPIGSLLLFTYLLSEPGSIPTCIGYLPQSLLITCTFARNGLALGLCKRLLILFVFWKGSFTRNDFLHLIAKRASVWFDLLFERTTTFRAMSALFHAERALQWLLHAYLLRLINVFDHFDCEFEFERCCSLNSVVCSVSKPAICAVGHSAMKMSQCLSDISDERRRRGMLYFFVALTLLGQTALSVPDNLQCGPPLASGSQCLWQDPEQLVRRRVMSVKYIACLSAGNLAT